MSTHRIAKVTHTDEGRNTRHVATCTCGATFTAVAPWGTDVREHAHAARRHARRAN